MYSAIKIIANIGLLYSILNPDTSIDSPSAKSNGVRWVSAIILIIHDKLNGIIRNIVHVNCSRGMLLIFIDDI